MPIQAVSRIEFENEGVVDLSTGPYFTVDTEQKKKEER